MGKKIIIIGGGGHGKVLCHMLIAAGHQVIGYLDPAFRRGDDVLPGIPVLGDDEAVAGYESDEHALANGIGYLPGSNARQAAYTRFRAQGYIFVSIVSKEAWVGSNVKLGPSVQIFAGAIIQYGVALGDNTIVNSGAVVDHDCVIGDHCHIATGATLAGGVKVGDNAFIGAGSTVTHGVSIGRNAVVAAGAICHEDVPDNHLCTSNKSHTIPYLT